MLWKWYLPLLWSRKLQTGTASFFFFLFTPGWGIEGLKRGTINTNNRGREQTWKAARRRAISTAPGPAFKSPSAAMQTDMVKRVWHKPQSQTGLIHGAWQQATSSGATAASRPFSRGGGALLLCDGWWTVPLSVIFLRSSLLYRRILREGSKQRGSAGWWMADDCASAWWQTDTIITVNLSPAAAPPPSQLRPTTQTRSAIFISFNLSVALLTELKSDPLKPSLLKSLLQSGLNDNAVMINHREGAQ